MAVRYAPHDFPVRYNTDKSERVDKGRDHLLTTFIDRLTDGKGLKGFFRRHSNELYTWAAFSLAFTVLALFFSDLSFSGILTLSSGFQLLSYSLILIKIFSSETVASISTQSLILTWIGLTTRLISTTQFNGYLPMDRSGDWLLQTIDGICLAEVTLSLYAFMYMYGETRNEKDDNLKAWMVLPLCLVLSPVLRANLNHHYMADNCWMFSLLVETAANMPQIVLISSQTTEVEGLTGHFLASQAVSKLFSLLFWASSYQELVVAGSSHTSSITIIVAYVLQVAVLGDFLYYYVRSIGTSSRLVLCDLDLI